jgi:hypothetical protein
MKNKAIKYFGLGLALAAGLTSAANAAIEYTWVYGGESTYAAGTTPVSSGSFLYTPGLGPNGSGGTVADFSFSENPGGADTAIVVGATFTVLANGNLVISGAYPGAIALSGVPLFFNPSPYLGAGPVNGGLIAYNALNQQAVEDNGQIGGDWVRAVPEPTTMVAGVLMLLPCGASTLRIVRRKQSV